MVATIAAEIIASIAALPRKSLNLAIIGCRPPFGSVRIVDEVLDVIADVSPVFAIGRTSAIYPHLLKGIFGQAQPGGCFLGVQERPFGFLWLIIRHRQRSTVAPRHMREREETSSKRDADGSVE